MFNEGTGRDLVGYAGEPPDIVWPNGARVAVSIVINYEEGAEWQVGDGDPVSERMGEVISVVESGKRDIGQEQIFAYGTRVGLWRFLGALKNTNTPATFFFCGQAISRTADLAKTVVNAGHEAACHGWRWRPHADYDNRDDEYQDLVRCVKAQTDTTGQRPYGFFCRGSESPWTRSLLCELGFNYTSNAFDDDLPYHDQSGLIVLPYNLDCNDMKFFHPNGFVVADDMVVYVKDAITQLLNESLDGRSSTLSIGFHLRISGRPARFRVFSEILSYLNGLGDQVWVTNRNSIADYFRQSHESNFKQPA